MDFSHVESSLHGLRALVEDVRIFSPAKIRPSSKDELLDELRAFGEAFGGLEQDLTGMTTAIKTALDAPTHGNLRSAQRYIDSVAASLKHVSERVWPQYMDHLKRFEQEEKWAARRSRSRGMTSLSTMATQRRLTPKPSQPLSNQPNIDGSIVGPRDLGGMGIGAASPES